MKKAKYDYDKLKGKVREIFKTNEKYSEFLGISEASLYEKYNSNSYFNQNQISRTMEAFKEDEILIKEYFFKEKVE